MAALQPNPQPVNEMLQNVASLLLEPCCPHINVVVIVDVDVDDVVVAIPTIPPYSSAFSVRRPPPQGAVARYPHPPAAVVMDSLKTLAPKAFDSPTVCSTCCTRCQ